MAELITTLGRLRRDQTGLILPHEHVFVDLGPIEAHSYRHADVDDVIRVMRAPIEDAKAAGVSVLVECTPEGVGRRVDIDKAVSVATHLPIVVPTGIYREPFVPEWAHDMSEEDLRDWMLAELNDEVMGTGIPAAWIKVSAGDDGITSCESKILRAAAQAGHETNAAIGSHTIRGRVVRDQLDIIESQGYRASRFIWIHTHAEPEFALHLEMLQRGAWIEYDAIGSESFTDEVFVELILRVLDAGYGHKLLLSQDRGWYDPSKPGGGEVKPYTYLSKHFLPKLREAGVDEATITQLTQDNPYNVYAR